ncbi:MAG: hydrogenase [Chloroflexi bacterium]|nr:hydrogenase [Chloroflexota bacterium]
MSAPNPMRPYVGTLVDTKDLATNIRLFRIRIDDPEEHERFAVWKPGQFLFLSTLGYGEAPFGFANIPAFGPAVEVAIHNVGHVTSHIHMLPIGSKVGVRGPLGNCFPMDEVTGKDIVVLGGGIGGAPLRPVIQHIKAHRADYGHLTIFWAARSPDLLVFTDEYEEWQAMPDTEMHVTIDRPAEGWTGNVGLITEILEQIGPSPQNTVAITCGPPIMIHFVGLTLAKLGFTTDQMLATLEARMHCGIGKCGRCNVGEKLICRDGPVFWQSEIKEFLERAL